MRYLARPKQLTVAHRLSLLLPVALDMKRRRARHRFPPQIAAVFGRASAHVARPAQRRRRPFQFERLEERLAMDGDNSLAAELLAADDSTVVVAATTAPNSDVSGVVDEIPGTFQTREELEAWLFEAAVAQWSHLFGQPSYSPHAHSNYPYFWFSGFDRAPILFGANALQLTAIDTTNFSLDSFSNTNVQVAGVDEADLIETDGEFLYVLSGKELMIVRAGIGEELELVSRVEISGRPVGMYLDGDRLAIVSSNEDLAHRSDPGLVLIDWDYQPYSPEPPTTTVTLLDISDRSAPALVQRTEMDGQLVASRVVEGELRLVLSSMLNFPPPKAFEVGPESEGASLEHSSSREMVINPIEGAQLMLSDYAYWRTFKAPYVFETEEEYLTRVRDEILSTALPQLRVLGLEGDVLSSEDLTDASSIYPSDQFDRRTLTTIATFDLSADEAGPAATRSIFTHGTPQVYATAESFYLFDEGTVNYDTDHYTGPNTAIHKFDFDAASHDVAYAARGYVEGTLLNQFAADEYEGHLRVVTTPDWGTFGQKLTVLKQIGQRLEVVGEVSALAPNEQVYSVRFMGERAFLVTFRQVDPLFALDLSDPTDPQVMGELKIPGYSDYLQPLNENHLLAIGRGADEATGLFQELQVSIFNIADLTDPKLVHRYSFDGGRAITTPATGDRWKRGDGDHHAVSYFAEAGVFALPILNTGEAGWWWSGVDTTSPLSGGEGGLQVFQIDVTTGFSPIGLIQHDTQINRSVRIGERLYAISSGAVTVHELTDPTIQLGELEFPGEDAAFTTLEVYVAPPAISSLASTELPAESDANPGVAEGSVAREVAPAERTQSLASTTEVALPRVDDVPPFAARSGATAFDRTILTRAPLAARFFGSDLLNLSRTSGLRSRPSSDEAFAALDCRTESDVDGHLAEDLALAWVALPAAN